MDPNLTLLVQYGSNNHGVDKIFGDLWCPQSIGSKKLENKEIY